MEVREPIEDAPAAFEKAGGFFGVESSQLVEPGFADPQDPSRPLSVDGILTARVLQAPGDI
jgi:hypothetical protein